VQTDTQNPYLSNTWHGRRITTTDCKGSIKHDTNLEGSNTKREVEIKEEVEAFLVKPSIKVRTVGGLAEEGLDNMIEMLKLS
jgi:hypothetical protein